MSQQRRVQKKVIVVGGGVAGLSAAHELIQRGFAVDVYERKALFGGKARSIDFKPKDGVLLPAEHGFRFFPGFYRHIIETMKGIPSGDRTVEQRLVAVSELRAVGDSKTNPMLGVLPLQPIWRPSAFRKWVAFLPSIVRSAPGKDGKRITGADLSFFSRRFWQFSTMGRERRLSELEGRPWSDFIDAKRSDAYGKYLSAGLSRNLVAAKAEEASTFTIGTIGVQLVWDVFRGLFSPSGLDRVLDGPTSDVWIEPWVDHLRSKGVKLYSEHELDQIDLAAGSPLPSVSGVTFRPARARAAQRSAASPVRQAQDVECWVKELASRKAPAEANQELAAKALDGERDDEKQRCVADYYIFAIPIEQIATFVTPAVQQLVPSWSTLPELARSVEWMNGVQFYLTKRSELPSGHTTYLDSDWSLTSIFQDDSLWRGWVAGDPCVQQILSVDVSNWTAPTSFEPRRGRSAAELTRSEVIEEVWDQVQRALKARPGYAVDDAHRRYAFVDDSIEERLNVRKALTFQRCQAHKAATRHAPPALLTNAEPLLVNEVNTRALRPCAAGDVANAFLASDYVLTETDLATMEGANEAARHAVKAILRLEGMVDDCQVFPLSEPLACLGRWDDRRFRRGLPTSLLVRSLGVLVGWATRAVLLASQCIDGSFRLAAWLCGVAPRPGEVSRAGAVARRSASRGRAATRAGTLDVTPRQGERVQVSPPRAPAPPPREPNGEHRAATSKEPVSRPPEHDAGAPGSEPPPSSRRRSAPRNDADADGAP